MPTQPAGRQIVANALAGAYATLGLHGGPGDQGLLELSGGSPVYARVAPVLTLGSGGSVTATATFNVPSGASVVGWSAWAANGVLLDGGTINVPQPYTQQGTYALSLSVFST